MKTRASRRFVPGTMFGLESRMVLSAMASTGAAAPVRLTDAQVAQSNASERSFGHDTTETLRSGTDVAEQKTIRYNDGSAETESLLLVPDLAANSVTTYETVNLRDNGGTQHVVQTETYSGGSQPLSGNNNTFQISITKPNGSIETETYREVINARKTVLTGSIQEPGGGIETFTTDRLENGPRTIANKLITEPNGTQEQQQSITIRRGDLDSTSTTSTTNMTTKSTTTTSSATDVTRVQPTSS